MNRWEVSKNGVCNCLKKKTYSFDHAFGPEVDTQSLFDSAVEPYIWDALEGFNGLVIL